MKTMTLISSFLVLSLSNYAQSCFSQPFENAYNQYCIEKQFIQALKYNHPVEQDDSLFKIHMPALINAIAICLKRSNTLLDCMAVLEINLMDLEIPHSARSKYSRSKLDSLQSSLLSQIIEKPIVLNAFKEVNSSLNVQCIANRNTFSVLKFFFSRKLYEYDYGMIAFIYFVSQESDVNPFSINEVQMAAEKLDNTGCSYLKKLRGEILLTWG